LQTVRSEPSSQTQIEVKQPHTSMFHGTHELAKPLSLRQW